MARSQLNINIDPDLLQRVKAHTIRQGKTVTEFGSQVLMMEAASEESSASIEERIARIEKHLGLDAYSQPEEPRED